ncbi:MAG: (E)-4-hydroxy-3-methylbut-2-enyl-diphosphate synthase [Bacteroidales bacterium]|nr:(E)-4-hydroxy-3-methylbut-2-enyl-diphosphate synthase [Bacteroidales bacterium]
MTTTSRISSGDSVKKKTYGFPRRHTSVAMAGGVGIGGDNPVRLQSMTNTDTLDIDGSVAQILRIAEAGGEIVRLTTQGVREAGAMKEIRHKVREAGCEVPLVADVHFNPQAAFAAAETCDKVRINPGNFVDAARTFRKLEFTEEEYAAEIERIRESFLPFLEKCRANDVCIRLGVNHGSLSDRIMSRYGDTPEGMVESVMEYLRIAREANFNNIVISIKASNVVVMTCTVRLLAEAMKSEGMFFPLHLGVTEAGDGEDGRVKSAVGIGSLMLEGYGDTIRVSLSEKPENEIPVAAMLRDFIESRKGPQPPDAPYNDCDARSLALPVPGFEGINWPVVVGDDLKTEDIPSDWHEADAMQTPQLYDDTLPLILSCDSPNRVAWAMSWIDRFVAAGGKNPVIVRFRYDTADIERLRIEASVEYGALLLRGYASGVWIDSPKIDSEDVRTLSLGILQAARLRFSKTEYIACPGCGRTLFDLHTTLQRVKEATAGMKGLKIGVMGCIVNGPGEMADADYGYVGAGPGKVSLYKGKTLVKKNIPTDDAIDELLALIESSSK